jgi:uncharacterized protein YdcH (DUF465 family)
MEAEFENLLAKIEELEEKIERYEQPNGDFEELTKKVEYYESREASSGSCDVA